ncbi:UNVERIFIED_CONTAM: hypothetical protein K2H54_050798 [Gekko kuhli]
MVEAVKKHILNMLHLRDRPNITQAVPKAALLNAIKKLHVGKVREDGYVEIEDDIGRRTEMNELVEQTSEIITFAESAEGKDTWSELWFRHCVYSTWPLGPHALVQQKLKGLLILRNYIRVSVRMISPIVLLLRYCVRQQHDTQE